MYNTESVYFTQAEKQINNNTLPKTSLDNWTKHVKNKLALSVAYLVYVRIVDCSTQSND